MFGVKRCDFQINIKDGKTIVRRDFVFDGGDEISFTAVLDIEGECKMKEIHMRSVDHIIKYLEEMRKPAAVPGS